MIRLNLGCGFKKHNDYVNVDKNQAFQPEVCIDLVKEKWPWENNSVAECMFEFSLEQMGSSPDDLRHVFGELYRVCAKDAKIRVMAFHPRHDQFFLNPLCTQRISVEFFHMLSIQKNMQMIAEGRSHDSLGLAWGVNFEVAGAEILVDVRHQTDLQEGRTTEADLRRRMNFENNICHVFDILISTIKD